MASKKIKANDRKYLIKENDLQLITHRHILSVGKKIADNLDKTTAEIFKDSLLEREKELLKETTKNHQILIDEQKCKYEKEIDRVKKEGIETLRHALKNETIRVEKLKKKVITEFFEKKLFDQKMKYEKTLAEMAEKFAIEKQAAIENCIKIKTDAANAETKLAQEKHENLLNQVNKSWSERLQNEKINTDKLLSELLSVQKNLEASFEELMKTKINDLNTCCEKRVCKLIDMNNDLQKENSSFRSIIKDLEKKLSDANCYVDKVLLAFQDFVDMCPGFCKGQGEFVLQNLAPNNAREIST
ncbi:calponin homology domain-containing protein DDB_G0272472 [Hydra vulgaris]|uniref:calponin homology domain-containing protein DDB_G0272472 n=1 Tax=Hydra vulgaris TaxID=6087 RepID=UPI00019276F5|nr:calponin homology domain-containing protein DDB_G0272472-like [Hydra vulgaris]